MIQVLKAGRTLKLVLFVSGELRVELGWAIIAVGRAFPS